MHKFNVGDIVRLSKTGGYWWSDRVGIPHEVTRTAVVGELYEIKMLPIYALLVPSIKYTIVTVNREDIEEFSDD